MNSNFLIFLIALFISYISSAQIKFTEGYIIDNNNQKIDCLIRNIGKEGSTLNFQYKLKDGKEIKKIELSKIKEFGIDNEMKCERALISIDVSHGRIRNLRDTVTEWEVGHAFLHVLVDGELASLYSYYDEGIQSFFFSRENLEIEPLIHKKYTLEITPGIVEQTLANNAYREQLKNHLNCDNPDDFKNIPYTKKALVDYFCKYHDCKTANYSIFKRAQVKKGSFRFKLGVNSNSIQLIVREFSDALPNAVFSKENSVGFGAEVEYVFPFNNYKWSLFAESNYFSYFSDYVYNESNSTSYDDLVIDYKTIEFPIGVSYYMNISDDHRLFVRTAFVPHFILSDSYIAFSEDYHSGFSPSSRLFLGGGYNYNRLGIEFRYYSNQNITANIYKRGSELSQLSLRVYYTLLLL